MSTRLSRYQQGTHATAKRDRFEAMLRAKRARPLPESYADRQYHEWLAAKRSKYLKKNPPKFDDSVMTDDAREQFEEKDK